MRTILIQSSLRLGLFAAVIFSSIASSAEQTLSFTLANGDVLSLSPAHHSPSASLKRVSSTHPVTIDAKTARSLKSADELIALSPRAFPMKGYEAVLLIARVPSQRSNPSGYCGAGHEDYLMLLALEKQRLKLLDDFLVQSCLESMVLASDQGDDPRNGIEVAPDARVLVKWLSHPKFGESKKTILIQDGKLSIQ
jgi:hypothetical protein